MDLKELERRNLQAEEEQRQADIDAVYKSKTHTDKRMKRNMISNVGKYRNQY